MNNKTILLVIFIILGFVVCLGSTESNNDSIKATQTKTIPENTDRIKINDSFQKFVVLAGYRDKQIIW